MNSVTLNSWWIPTVEMAFPSFLEHIICTVLLVFTIKDMNHNLINVCIVFWLKLQSSQFAPSNQTWQYMASIFAVIETSRYLNLNKILVRLFSKSESVNKILFDLIQSCSAAESKTIPILSDLHSLKTGWRGKYQVFLLFF